MKEQNKNEQTKSVISEKKSVGTAQKRKRKKLLRTPSHILRLCIIWAFVFTIYFLSMPFMSITLYINEELETTTDYNEVSYVYASQDEIDSANEALVLAIDNLEELPDEDVEEDGVEYNASLNTIVLNWIYSISSEVDASELLENIETAKSVERNLYTEDSLNELSSATLNAQRTLAASVTISQTALQLMLGGTVGEAYGYESSVSTVAISLYAFALLLLPFMGFLAASFDKSRHIKHVITMLACVLAIIDIMFIVYPYIDIGAVLSLIMYVIICIITSFSIYAKQQEDYIVNHPELESEFSEKHPQFVKALINAKAMGLIENLNNEKAKQKLEAAKNAQKRRQKKK